MAKAHKNPIFVLGDDCREPSSAHWSSALPATSPAGCIWQQYARQQIAATYHATCRRACHRRELPRACCRELPPCDLPPCATAGTPAAGEPAAKTYLPLILPCIPPRNYRKKLPPCATCRSYYRAYPRATYLPGILPRDESYRAMGPAPSGRVIRM